MKKKGNVGVSLLVVYRACSVGSKAKKRPIQGKINLVSVCFESFLKAFKNTDIQLKVLLDKPTNELRKIFAGYDTEETYYSTFTEGNIGSFHRQIDLALEVETPFLFVEDDYFFLPNSGEKIVSALKEFPFITPYDHPGYYSEERHKYPRKITVIGNHHWATIKSTTLTFGGKHESLLKEAKTMKKYGWADSPMWEDITQRMELYAPIPTFATHCEVDYLSPSIDWRFANPNNT